MKKKKRKKKNTTRLRPPPIFNRTLAIKVAEEGKGKKTRDKITLFRV